ncbi:MAG: hypothetical protein ACE5H1_01155 [Thermodesulfobacteriota bacterium]
MAWKKRTRKEDLVPQYGGQNVFGGKVYGGKKTRGGKHWLWEHRDRTTGSWSKRARKV